MIYKTQKAKDWATQTPLKTEGELNSNWSFHVFLITQVSCTKFLRGRRGRDRMVAIFTSTYAISAYHH